MALTRATSSSRAASASVATTARRAPAGDLPFRHDHGPGRRSRRWRGRKLTSGDGPRTASVTPSAEVRPCRVVTTSTSQLPASTLHEADAALVRQLVAQAPQASQFSFQKRRPSFVAAKQRPSPSQATRSAPLGRRPRCDARSTPPVSADRAVITGSTMLSMRRGWRARAQAALEPQQHHGSEHLRGARAVLRLRLVAGRSARSMRSGRPAAPEAPASMVFDSRMLRRCGERMSASESIAFRSGK